MKRPLISLSLVTFVTVGGFALPVHVYGEDFSCGSPNPSLEGPAIAPDAVCAVAPRVVGPIKNPTMEKPDRRAWKLFMENNRPFNSGKQYPLWRSWPEQAEVYPAAPNPLDPPQWGYIADIEPVFRGRPSKQHEIRQTKTDDVACNVFGTSNAEEVRINKHAFNYIIANNLWFVQGKAERFKTGESVDFPTGAREVKANWILLEKAEQALGHKINTNTYYWQKDSKGQTWLLIAMHMMDKSIPNWLWATFEHKDNPCFNKYLKAQDDFGVNASGNVSNQLTALFKKSGINRKPWSNYRLAGAQTEFTDATGRPIVLGNSVTEFGFQTTASCMTCHARATTDATGAGFLSVFNADKQSYNGTPLPGWFFSVFTPKPQLQYLPLDFLWSVGLCPNAVGTTQQNCPLPVNDN